MHEPSLWRGACFSAYCWVEIQVHLPWRVVEGFYVLFFILTIWCKAATHTRGLKAHVSRKSQKFCRARMSHSVTDFSLCQSIVPENEWCVGEVLGALSMFGEGQGRWGAHMFLESFLFIIAHMFPLCCFPPVSKSVCVYMCVWWLSCTISVIHLFICHRCYHGYYRLTAVFSLRRTQVSCGKGDSFTFNGGMLTLIDSLSFYIL